MQNLARVVAATFLALSLFACANKEMETVRTVDWKAESSGPDWRGCTRNEVVNELAKEFSYFRTGQGTAGVSLSFYPNPGSGELKLQATETELKQPPNAGKIAEFWFDDDGVVTRFWGKPRLMNRKPPASCAERLRGTGGQVAR